MREDDLRHLRATRALILDREAFAERFLAALGARVPLDRWFRERGGDAAAARMVHALLEGATHRIAELGARHAASGICETDYDDVGVAFLTTLRAELGDAYTPAVEQAWASAYGEMAEAMIAAVVLPATR